MRSARCSNAEFRPDTQALEMLRFEKEQKWNSRGADYDEDRVRAQSYCVTYEGAAPGTTSQTSRKRMNNTLGTPILCLVVLKVGDLNHAKP
jgi:hypothetical protein